MLHMLKLLKWNFSDKYGRLLFYQFFIREIPGTFGEYIRQKVLSRYFAKCGSNVIIHQGVRFRGIHLLSIGNNVNIGVDNFIQASGKVTLEDSVMLGPGVKIWSINHKTEDVNIPISEQGYEYKEVTLGEGVWLGANVIVLPGVTLPKGCVVSAGSVVGVKVYPEFAIIAGNPARVIGSRLGTEKKTESVSHV